MRPIQSPQKRFHILIKSVIVEISCREWLETGSVRYVSAVVWMILVEAEYFNVVVAVWDYCHAASVRFEGYWVFVFPAGRDVC